ncbi:MAG: SCO family protein [Gammaproteobacteria bacterium]|nr:SCO family protein [Gammaproteobacteria bacterium]
MNGTVLLKRYLYGLSIALTLALGITALTFATSGWQAYTTEATRRLEVQNNPRPVPAVTLEDSRGRRFNLADLRGRPLLVDFIYTGCADACTDLGENFQKIQARLPLSDTDKAPLLLSISFDLERDKPAQLRHYGKRFDADSQRWRIARPVSEAGLERLLKRFGVVVLGEPPQYVHNAAIYKVDAEGQLTRIFDYDRPQAAIDSFQHSS